MTERKEKRNPTKCDFCRNKNIYENCPAIHDITWRGYGYTTVTSCDCYDELDEHQKKAIILKFLDDERIKAPISVEWYLIRIKDRIEKEENIVTKKETGEKK